MRPGWDGGEGRLERLHGKAHVRLALEVGLNDTVMGRTDGHIPQRRKIMGETKWPGGR